MLLGRHLAVRPVRELEPSSWLSRGHSDVRRWPPCWERDMPSTWGSDSSSGAELGGLDRWTRDIGGFTEVDLQEDIFQVAENAERRHAGRKVVHSLEADTSAKVVSTENLPTGVNPIDFAANEEEAFAVENAQCCEGADRCPVVNELLVSHDGGKPGRR